MYQPGLEKTRQIKIRMLQKFNSVIYILFLGCIIALFISIRKCNSNAENYNGSQNYIASLNDTLQHLKNGVVQKPVIEVTKDAFENIVKERDDLQQALKAANIKANNVRSFTGVITGTDIGSKPIEIKIHDTLPCPDFEPVPFKAMDKNYLITGKLGKGTLWFDTINFPDSISIITATRSHLFKKNEYNVLVRHSNPMVKTLGAMNLTITEPRKWYTSGWAKAGAGFVAGSYLTYRLTR